MTPAPGAAEEEAQSDAEENPSPVEELGPAVEAETENALADSEQWMTDEEIEKLLGGMGDEEEEPQGQKKPFGNQIITEDEAVEMDRK